MATVRVWCSLALVAAACGPGARSAPPVVVANPVTVAIGDADHDGVRDDDDLCPAAAEDADGCDDVDGCAEPDVDLDHVLDRDDRCPRVAGRGRADGCPAPPSGGTVIVSDADREMIMLDAVYFQPGSTTLTHPDGWLIIDEIAASLLRSRRLLRVEARGTTDDVEDPALGGGRARVVRDYLITKGVDSKCVRAQGHGAAIRSEHDQDDRAVDRRVEFRVVTVMECPDRRP